MIKLNFDKEEDDNDLAIKEYEFIKSTISKEKTIKRQIREEKAIEDFENRCMELVTQTFIPIYARISRQYWYNSTFTRMPKPYTHVDHEGLEFETCIPTFMDIEQNMKYHRIVVKILPTLDKKTMLLEGQKLLDHKKTDPNGKLDSQTIFLVARKLTADAKKLWDEDHERKKRGEKQLKLWVFKDRKLAGHVDICPIFARVPELALKRILKILKGFYAERLKKLAQSFNLEDLAIEHGYKESNLYYIISSIVESRNLSGIANSIRCMNHILNWLCQKEVFARKEVARQSFILGAIEKLRQIQPLLKEIAKNKNPYSSKDVELVETISRLARFNVGRLG